MSRMNGNRRQVAAMLLAIALSACGTIQGSSSIRAAVPANGSSGDVHLTEFDANDTSSAAISNTGIDPQLQQAIALDQQNEQQRLAEQGRSAPPSGMGLGGDSAGNTTSAPALVP